MRGNASHANRGMPFENLITMANLQYERQRIAVINKRPTPVKVLRTKGAQILKSVYDRKSTVDYDGVYLGRSIYFEAKSTKERTRLPLDMIHGHQIEYLEKADACGALCFLLVEFSTLHMVFYLPMVFLRQSLFNASLGGRKSIPISDFEEYCYEVKSSKRAVLDYLQIVDLELGESGWKSQRKSIVEHSR